MSDLGTTGPHGAFDPLGIALLRIREAASANATKLDLSGLNLGPTLPAEWAGWTELHDLQNLWDLDLSNNGIVDIPPRGWASLARLSGLKWLELDKNHLSAIPAEGWAAMKDLDLKCLNLDNNQMKEIPAEGWDALDSMPSLSRLYLFGNPIADFPVECWQVLQRKSLKALYLGHDDFTLSDESWEAIGGLTTLDTLYLRADSNKNVSAAGCEAIASLKNLEWLLLRCKMAEATWRALGNLVKLELLISTGMSEEGKIPWSALRGLDKLTELIISGGSHSIPDEGWSTLGRYRDLKVLGLYHNQISEHLRACLDAARVPSASSRT